MPANRSILLGLLGASALLAAGPAYAHAHLVAATPAANAKVHTAPKTIALTFSEALVPAFSKLTLSMPAHGMTVPVKSAVDGKRIIGTPAGRLSKGAYKVTWTAASVDGHKMSGDLSFTVE